MPRAAAALTVVLVVLGSALSGCARQGNPYALPEYNNSDAAAALAARSRPSATVRPGSPKVERLAKPPAAVKYTPADPRGQGAWVERGSINAGTIQDRAVVDAAVKYLSLFVQLSNTWLVDQPAVAAVASGQAVTATAQRAALERSRGWRTTGRFIVNVSSVQVTGASASVTGCHFDATSEVDQNGSVVVAPPGGVRITMELQRTGDTWRVSQWPEKPPKSCDWRVR
jgi:hypothetical protein